MGQTLLQMAEIGQKWLKICWKKINIISAFLMLCERRHTERRVRRVRFIQENFRYQVTVQPMTLYVQKCLKMGWKKINVISAFLMLCERRHTERRVASSSFHLLLFWHLC